MPDFQKYHVPIACFFLDFQHNIEFVNATLVTIYMQLKCLLKQVKTLLDKDLFVERLKSEGFSKTAKKVQQEPDNSQEDMKKDLRAHRNIQKPN